MRRCRGLRTEKGISGRPIVRALADKPPVAPSGLPPQDRWASGVFGIDRAEDGPAHSNPQINNDGILVDAVHHAFHGADQQGHE
jgi:hypothetical protein